MTASELQAVWTVGAEQAMALLGQPTVWRTRTLQAIVDSLSYGTELRAKGGGLVEQFAGTVVYLKSDFVGNVYPVVGDTITIPASMGQAMRNVKVESTEGLLDVNDPFLTCRYEPFVK